jgi:crotonobetainyl-CoA:carnitine CoA-transferase CaiB-like acyl-CoA transferase
MTGMFLADHGADVVRVERPGGGPLGALSGHRVWNRGKRSIELDLASEDGATAFRRLCDRADVVLTDFGPGVAARLGVDAATLRRDRPQLVVCELTGYGDTRDADRPAYEALVAARTGYQWEHRGVEGGTIARLSGVDGMMSGLEAPDGCWVGADRPGPLFGGVPWPSLACFYLATLGISAALRVRERTGHGQRVHTSLLQGVLATTIGPWQRVERPDTPMFQTWVIDPRAPKGFFRAADGRWTHHWVPLPAFVLGSSQGDALEVTDEVTAPKEAPMRIGTHPEEMVVLQYYTPLLAQAVARFPASEWVDFAASVGVPVQPVRSPEEALHDAAFLADGCVTEVDDPDVGTIRQVGSVVRLAACGDAVASTPAPAPGAHTDEILAELLEPDPRPARHFDTDPVPAAPLEGVVVLDLGLAVAGPFGTQLLADLGATVIKVTSAWDDYWMGNHIAMCCNRGKRAVTIDLKSTDGLAVLHRLVERADVVQHNMRYDAAERLGVDHASLRAVKPDLVYCHTRGFEHGDRERLPGNDQTGAALAGTEWMDGGLDDDGNPLWSLASMGDTGNGFLSAIGIVQALLHRDRTGEGQFVDTSIVYAQLLNASSAWVTPDGARRGDRPSLDHDQTGFSAGYRLYETSDGWLCLAAVTDQHWERLLQCVGRGDLRAELAEGGSLADAGSRRARDDELTQALGDAFAQRPATTWVKDLDAAGVPAEVSDPDWVLGLFDDPELLERGWVTSYEHPTVGRMDVAGLLVDLSLTPGVVQHPPVVPGRNTREVLLEFGFGADEIDALLVSGAVNDRPRST